MSFTLNDTRRRLTTLDDLYDLIVRNRAASDRQYQQLMQEIQTMSGAQSALQTAVDGLVADVAQLTTVDASAIALLNGIPAMINNAVTAAVAAGAPPATLQAITDAATAIATNTSALAGAVTANTPAAAPAAPAATDTTGGAAAGGTATVAGAAGPDTTGGAATVAGATV